MLVSKWWVAVPCACVTFLIQLNKCFIQCLLFNQHGVHNVTKDISEVKHVSIFRELTDRVMPCILLLKPFWASSYPENKCS